MKLVNDARPKRQRTTCSMLSRLYRQPLFLKLYRSKVLKHKSQKKNNKKRETNLISEYTFLKW